MQLSKKYLNAHTIVLGALITLLLTSGIAYAANEWSGQNINDGTLTNVDLKKDTITSAKIRNGTITGADVADGSLSNQDIGVLFAQVNADGSIFNSSGGVTSLSLGTGTYEVDFGRNISGCAFVSTQGEGSIGGAGGAITGVTDRSGNNEAVFATTRNTAGTLANTAFQLVVVC